MANLNSRSYPKGLREIRYPSNDIIHRYTSRDYTGEIRLNNETGEFEFNPPLQGVGGNSAGTTFTINQSGHGFTVGKPITHNGVYFELANASSSTTLGIWFVTEVTSPDTFIAAQSGRFELTAHGLIPGNFYFVGTTNGSLTPNEPAVNSNPIVYVESNDVIHVLPYRPSSTGTSGGGGGGGAVDSVFGRVGNVTAQSGDYTPSQVGLGNVINVAQIPASEKGVNNGVATLDGGGKVPISQLPVSIQGGINIIGFWDADVNQPDLNGLTLQDGQAYQVAIGGTTNINGITQWDQYDLVVWDSLVSGNWFKITSSAKVNDVNGQTGSVVLTTSDIPEGTNLYYTDSRVNLNPNVVSNTSKISADGSISTHSDVDTTTVGPVNGQTLVWDGSSWIPGNIAGGVTSVNTQTGAVILDADDINDSSTTNKFTTQSDINKLSGIESGAQVNVITNNQVAELTGFTDSNLHFHFSDRNRSNHTGTQTANTISDIQATISSNVDVSLNTSKISADGSVGTHSDVNMNSPAPSNGQVLSWDGPNNQWHATTISGTLPGGIEGDILYHDGIGWVKLAKGLNEQILTSNGTLPSWENAPISLPNGTQGDVIYHNGTDWAILNPGTAGDVLTTNGASANPSWEESSGGTNRVIDITPVVLVDASTTDVVINDGVSTYSIPDLVTTLAFTTSNGSDVEEFTAKRILDNSLNTSAVSLTWSDSNLDWTWDDSLSVTGPSGLAAGGVYVLELEVESSSKVFASLIPKAV